MNEIKNKRQAAQVLARIIAENPIAVKDALFESGVDVSPNASDRQVIDSIVNNIGRNRMLQERIGSLSEGQEFFATEGNAGNGQGFFANQQNVQAVGNVVGQALGFWLGSRREKKQAEATQSQLEQQTELARINAEMVQSQLELEQTRLGKGGQGLTMGAKIGIGLGAVALIGLTIFLAVRREKSITLKNGSRRS